MADEQPKKVVLNAASNSDIKPSDVTKTIPAAGASGLIDTSTAKKQRTIKLKPIKPTSDMQAPPQQEETVTMKRDAVAPGAPPPSGEQLSEEDDTVKIQKPVRTATAVPPPIPGVKQTIKLRPSSATPEPAQPPSPAEFRPAATKATLKLTPTRPPTVPPPAPVAPPPPFQTPPSQAQAPEQAGGDAPKKTIKLMAKKPSAPTVKLEAAAGPSAPPAPQSAPPSAPTMRMPEEPPMEATQSAAGGGKKTLKLRSAGAPPPPPPPQMPPGEAAMETQHGAPAAGRQPTSTQPDFMMPRKAEQPSALAAVFASLSVATLGYLFYLLASQYNNLFMK